MCCLSHERGGRVRSLACTLAVAVVRAGGLARIMLSVLWACFWPPIAGLLCVETTVVVDTLGPARRRTHGLRLTVRCQWKKKDRLDADLWTLVALVDVAVVWLFVN